MRDRFEELYRLWQEQSLSASEFRELKTLLENGEIRSWMREELELSSLIAEFFMDQQADVHGNIREMRRLKPSRKASVTSHPKTRGRLPIRHARRPARWLSVAACLVIVAGALAYNHWRAGQFGEVLVAHIRATAPDVEIVRQGSTIIAVIDMGLLPGDVIRTMAKQRMRFTYDGETTEIEVKERTGLEIGIVETGKRLHLEKGTIRAVVAPQSAGREMVVLTPHAKAKVKGTGFSLAVDWKSTRLEVTDGIVRLARLSDDTFVDVATGQYAVVAEGVELAALALQGESTAGVDPGEDPKLQTHLDGKIVFEDDFSDGSLDNWEVVRETPGHGYSAVTGNTEQYWQIGKKTLIDGAETPCLYVKGGGHDEYDVGFGIRSKRPITAERFVVEVHMSYKVPGGYVHEWGLENVGGVQVIEQSETMWKLPSTSRVYRWEFTPAKDAARDGMLYCRSSMRLNRDGAFHERRKSFHISSKTRQILIASTGTRTKNPRASLRRFEIYRVVVREMKEEPVPEDRR